MVGLTLTLLETRVLLVDHIQLPLPPYDLTIGAAFLIDARTFMVLNYYLYLNIILPLVRSYGLISTPTLSPGKIRI